MKNIYLICFFLIFTSISYAKYDPLLVSQLIDKSTIIGVGEIKSIENRNVLVLFSDVIKGKLTNRTLKIEKFENWTCASRWTNYKKGQKIMFFLTMSKEGIFKILGSGNEGELPIAKEKIYYKSLYGGLDKTSTKFVVYGSDLYGYSFNFLDVKNGILEYISNRLTYHKIAKQKNNEKQKIKNPFLKKLVSELYIQIYQYQ
ncbi:MAG: hypothetical protein ACI9L6_000768 [Flavobacterium sp.]|jgi:hypothetical protein